MKNSGERKISGTKKVPNDAVLLKAIKALHQKPIIQIQRNFLK